MSLSAVVALFVLVATCMQAWTTGTDLQENHRAGISTSAAAAELRGTIFRPIRWLRRSSQVRAMIKQQPAEWRAYRRVELTLGSWVLLVMAASGGFFIALVG